MTVASPKPRPLETLSPFLGTYLDRENVPSLAAGGRETVWSRGRQEGAREGARPRSAEPPS